MRNYATALKMRRELAHMTVRELSEKIGRSSTFVTDFELKKKANPPEPDMMRRLSQALNWSEDEQLRAWGYELSSNEDRRGNPFPPNDPRWRIVVKLQRLDINDAGASFTVKALEQLLDLYLTEDELFIGPLGNASNSVDDVAHVYDDKGEQ